MFANMYTYYELDRWNSTDLWAATEKYYDMIHEITFKYNDEILQNNRKTDVFNEEVQKVMKANYCPEVKMNDANVTLCNEATAYSHNADLKSSFSNQNLMYEKFHYEHSTYTQMNHAYSYRV